MDLKEIQLVQAQKKANELTGINQRLSEELRKAQDKLKKLQEQYDELYYKVNAAELNKDSEDWSKVTTESVKQIFKQEN